ncbi:MAG: Holliday junction resolvase RuvX [Firmicutes bacterium]|nr:Holliday junction resolvase RuvX [Bacillota bacterium]
MGLDFGDKTIGVSVSSPSGKVAVGITTLTRQEELALRSSLKALKLIIKEYGITNIVLGYPKHLDGRDSQRCEKTLAFKDKLNRYFKSMPVELWDERLSTRAVSRVFEGTRQQFEKHVDEMAAVYILQGFLDSKQSPINSIEGE